MTKNYKGTGSVLNFLNDYGHPYKSGDVVVFGERIGSVIEDIDVDKIGEINVVGVYELPKDNQEIFIGDLVYWDSSQKRITLITEGNTFAGYAFSHANLGASVVDVKINA